MNKRENGEETARAAGEQSKRRGISPNGRGTVKTGREQLKRTGTVKTEREQRKRPGSS